MISMRSTLLGAYIHGIRNLLVVTGDPVPGESRIKTTGVFDYNSVKLMEYIKEMNAEHFADEPIHYGGALNYARGNIDKVAEHMKRKIEAGATYFLTQPIFSKEDAKRIQTLKSMVDTKILCGIMPLVSYRNACFIKNEISGIHVPDEIVGRYRPDMLREEAEDVGACIAREIMELLSPFADGYYFMLPFNRVSLMDKILKK
jgi:homocysteine S-methyltransferase